MVSGHIGSDKISRAILAGGVPQNVRGPLGLSYDSPSCGAIEFSIKGVHAQRLQDRRRSWDLLRRTSLPKF